MNQTTSTLLLVATGVFLYGCQAVCGGGTVAEFCAEHSCPGSWDEARDAATGDTGAGAFGCEDGDKLATLGYLHGRHYLFDGQTEELVGVKEITDTSTWATRDPACRTWGEEIECTYRCSYEGEVQDDAYPVCEETK